MTSNFNKVANFNDQDGKIYPLYFDVKSKSYVSINQNVDGWKKEQYSLKLVVLDMYTYYDDVTTKIYPNAKLKK